MTIDTTIRLLADGLMFVIGALALYSFVFRIPRNKWWYWGWRVVAAGVTCYLVAKIVGHLYQPTELRPFEVLGLEPGAAFLPNPGFPSDHALFATFLTLAVWFTTCSRAIAGTMLLLTLAMCVGRVLALVHTPLDVAAGILIAFSGIFWYYYRRTGKNIVQ